jgi:hypothetical protein
MFQKQQVNGWQFEYEWWFIGFRFQRGTMEEYHSRLIDWPRYYK